MSRKTKLLCLMIAIGLFMVLSGNLAYAQDISRVTGTINIEGYSNEDIFGNGYHIRYEWYSDSALTQYAAAGYGEINGLPHSFSWGIYKEGSYYLLVFLDKDNDLQLDHDEPRQVLPVTLSYNTPVEGLQILLKDVSSGTNINSDVIDLLLAFSVVSNYPDGEYHPEGLVTREEMAEYLVIILGLTDEAANAVGYTYYSDVALDQPSLGYINICKEEGFFKGYPDGTFRPTGNLTYAEVLTLLLRALGYTDWDVEGSWPDNYINKANDLGITNGLLLNNMDNVNRGDMAVLLYNTLNAHVLMTTIDDYTDETKWMYTYESKYTLLEHGLEITKKENSLTYLNSDGNDIFTQTFNYDLNGDDVIDLFDLVILAKKYGTSK